MWILGWKNLGLVEMAIWRMDTYEEVLVIYREIFLHFLFLFFFYFFFCHQNQAIDFEDGNQFSVIICTEFVSFQFQESMYKNQYVVLLSLRRRRLKFLL